MKPVMWPISRVEGSGSSASYAKCHLVTPHRLSSARPQGFIAMEGPLTGAFFILRTYNGVA